MSFTNQTFEQFFAYHFGIDIYTEKYELYGASKAKRLRAFLRLEDDRTVATALRELWNHRQSIFTPEELAKDTDATRERYFTIVRSLEGVDVPSSDALEQFTDSATVEELIAALERDMAANRPEASLDRLHTYCMKLFAHLLEQRGVAVGRSEALNSRVGRYVKALEAGGNLREMSLIIMKSSISVFDRFNRIRNDHSLAHDNEVLDRAEAQFIFSAVCNILRFVKHLETSSTG